LFGCFSRSLLFTRLTSYGPRIASSFSILEAIHHEMEEMNKRLDSANKMHGDLNRTAQWFVDREAERLRESLPQ
jgi:hypothetical protein